MTSGVYSVIILPVWVFHSRTDRSRELNGPAIVNALLPDKSILWTGPLWVFDKCLITEVSISYDKISPVHVPMIIVLRSDDRVDM